MPFAAWKNKHRTEQRFGSERVSPALFRAVLLIFVTAAVGSILLFLSVNLFKSKRLSCGFLYIENERRLTSVFRLKLFMKRYIQKLLCGFLLYNNYSYYCDNDSSCNTGDNYDKGGVVLRSVGRRSCGRCVSLLGSLVGNGRL